jgi:predicted ATPase/DNA-binding SARP family transcriptional activator
MTRACFGILGTLDVRVADTQLEINAMQLRRLLCVLLLAPGRPVSQATLAECMWPETDGTTTAGPRDPLATLRVYSSRLRRLLPARVGPHGDVRGYRLDVGQDEVDAQRFEELLSQKVADPAQAATTLREALRLWRGPALAEFSDESWALGAAVRLNELRLVALERLHDARLALGEHGELCGELEHLLDEHPLRERMWAQLMLALYRSGRQADSLRAYQRLRTRLGEDLGIEPSRELVGLEGAVLRQDSALDLSGPSGPGARGHSASAPSTGGGAERRSPRGGRPVGLPGTRTNLPAQLTSFVGRSRETTEIRHLAARSRLVTLTGAGGAGKTRLALEVAADLLDDPPGGVWLLELAALRQAGEVDAALASVLGIHPRVGDTVLEALVEALGGEQLLLLIDNCEHLISACATLCAALVRSCPGIGILTTSREPLGVEGESVYRVPSLGVPELGTEEVALIARKDAVQLFVDRASTHQHSFVLDASNAGLVASLCRQLDGIPLALELAAARLRALSLAQIHARLGSRFQLLVGGSPTRLPRQQTLTALIDWSYDLLNPAERWLLRRLAVFGSSFDLDSAVAVVEAGDDQWTVLENISSLVDKRLVVAETDGATARYRLLETIRQYALDHLVAEEGDEVLARLRNAARGGLRRPCRTGRPGAARRRSVRLARPPRSRLRQHPSRARSPPRPRRLDEGRDASCRCCDSVLRLARPPGRAALGDRGARIAP